MGRARDTVTRRLSTIAGFYKYTVEEELLGASPAAHVRRPRVDYESHTVALDRNELGALLVAAGSPASRARSDLAARAERAADLRGYRRGHRAPGPGARPPDADHHQQGRQDRHHSAGAAHCPGDRPGHRRTHRRAVCSWPRTVGTTRPAQRRPDRPQDGPPGWDRQDRHAPHAQTRVHYRRPGRRSAAAGRAGGRFARGSADDDEV